MASNLFKNAVLSSVGTSDAYAYIVPAGKKTLAIQFDVTNTIPILNVDVDIFVFNAASSTKIYLRKSAPIQSGLQISAIENGKKIVLLAGDKLGCSSSVADSLDVHISVLEDVN